ncbi:MAG: Abi family protein [Prevotellaceae bacterium]|jgi:abortive infection bacteriophage resistance protein|nr:Abi family protein [Prevotellaceae bacterium]
MNNVSKPAYTIADQISLLQKRGMLFRDKQKASRRLQNISYYRLRGYWWDTQSDTVSHIFRPDTYFENIIERYDFDRQLRVILFEAIEQIEIAVRAKLIYHLSLAYGGLWYLNTDLFQTTTKKGGNASQTAHARVIQDLQKEFSRSQETFITEHLRRNPDNPAEAWKILEVATMGTLSKLYKNLKTNLPERSIIAREMGLNSPHLFSSWLESIAYMRNIIAHHARLWNRTLIKKPSMQLKNPADAWFAHPLKQGQLDKPFSTISCMVYLCSRLSRSQETQSKIRDLVGAHPTLPIYKYGFLNNWQSEPLWKI